MATMEVSDASPSGQSASPQSSQERIHRVGIGWFIGFVVYEFSK